MTVTTIKWTIEDYHRLLEVGLLEERHVELLNGEIVEMPPGVQNTPILEMKLEG